MLIAENRTYLQDGEIQEKGFFKILDEDKQAFTVPKSLYKYYSLKDYNIKAVINHYLYASDRWQLNDPFDCHSGLIDFDNLNDKDRNEIEKEYSFKGDTFHDAYMYFWAKLFFKFGIISLSKNSCDKLMWAHYTNNNGFNIEFDPSLLNFEGNKGIFPINYVKNLTPFKGEQGVKEFEPFLYATNIKFCDWTYENEWRIIAFKKQMNLSLHPQGKPPERNFEYAINAIKSITLGPLFFDLKTEFIDGVLTVCSLRAKLLDFIINNNIPVSWVVNPEYPINNKVTYDFKPSRIKLQKTGIYKYTFRTDIS